MMGQLGDYLEILGGGTPSRDVDAYWNGDLPWATVKDLTTKRISETYESITTRGAAECATNVVPENTLLISTRMALGRMSITDVPMAFNQDLKALKIIGPVDQDYLFHFLSSKESYFKSRGNGATVKGFKVEDIRSIPFDPPPLPTQRRIAAVLDKAQALVANDKRTLALYDQLAKSLFLELFGDPVRNERGWEVVTMNEVATKVTDGEHATPRRSEKGQLLLSARNIRNRAIDLSPGVDYVEQDEFDRIYRRCNPQRGDILISCSGSIGRTTKVRTDQPIVLVRSVALVKPDHAKIDGDYLEQFLLSDYMQAMMQKSAKSSSQANLFTGPIKELPILLPPMNEQMKWKTAIEKIDTQRAQAEQSLRQSEGLFGSLLQSAFSGVLLQ